MNLDFFVKNSNNEYRKYIVHLYLRDGSRKKFRRNAPHRIDELLEAEIMKLTYRGVTYDYNPTVIETVEGEVGGQYRGLDWRFRNLKKPPMLQPSVNLTYRGVAYNNHPTSTEEKAATSVNEKARRLMLDKEKAESNRAVSMLYRSAQESGLV